MKLARTYTVEAVEAAQEKLRTLIAEAERRPKMTTEGAVKVMRGEIKRLLEAGMTFEQIASALRTGDNLGIISLTAATLKRYYNKANATVAKPKRAKSKANSAAGTSAVAAPMAANRTAPIPAKPRASTANRFAAMPEPGAL